MDECEQTCVNCGDDIGIHHLCSDCLAYVGIPIWTRCPMCEDFWCTHHGEHAHDCACGSIDDLLAAGIDPYRTPAGFGRRHR